MICPLTRVLLVEDTDPFANLVTTLLDRSQNARFSCVRARRMGEVQKFLPRDVDLVLLDLTLPDSSGADSVRRMHEQLPGVPIVVLTGHDNDDLALQAMQEGADDYIVKGDMNDGQLIRALRYATERNQARRALEESRQFLRSAVDALSARIAILDEDGNVIEVNKTWRNMPPPIQFGSSTHSGGVNYLSILDNMAAKGLSAAAAAAALGIRKVLAGERDEFHIEFSQDLCDAHCWFGLRVTRFSDNHRRLVVAIEDITERKQAEAKLASMHSRLLASHELLQATQDRLIQAAKLEAVRLLAVHRAAC